MDIVSTIFSAAKAVGVSGSLLLAICHHESQGFTKKYNPADKGSPSYGVCQIKLNTGKMLGFKGEPIKLNDDRVSILYAAKYLKYQENRYGSDDWLTLTAAYNAGSYNASSKIRGCPRNLKYVKLVQAHLPSELQSKLNCGKNSSRELANN